MTDARNPDRNRRALLVELCVVLAVVWLPLFVAGSLHRDEPREQTIASELYGMATYAGIIFLLLFLLWRNGESWRHVGLRRFRWWSEILWAILIYAACWISWSLIDTWGSMVFGEAPQTRTTEQTPSTLYLALLPVVFAVSAFFEELLVRGYLWNRLVRITGNKWVSLVASAFLFTVYHPYPLRELVYIFTFGVVLGLFYWKSRSLPRLILAHALFNVSITWLNLARD